MQKQINLPSWAQYLFTPARFKIAYGGRGSSKSWSFADALIINAINHKERILCAREIQKSIRDSSKKLLEDRIEDHGLSDIFEIIQTSIKCTLTGSEFLFSGLKDGAASLKSMEGITKVWVEEANAVSQESIDTLIPTVRTPNSEIWFTFNPKTKQDPVYTMFIANEPPPNTLIKAVNYPDNPWFPDVLRQQMEWDKARDNDKYRHIWLGEPLVHSEAQVMGKCWRVESIPTPPEGTDLYYGADWGFANDPTTLVRCWFKGTTMYVDQAIFGVGVEIDQTPAFFDRVPDSRKWIIVADCARPETISHMRRAGFRMKPSAKGKNSVEDGIAFLKSFNIVIDPRLTELIDEFTLYSYKVDSLTDEITPTIIDKHNHGIDALRYACEKIRRGNKLSVEFA